MDPYVAVCGYVFLLRNKDSVADRGIADGIMEAVNLYREEVLRLKKELALAESMYRLVIKERDYERAVVTHLQLELNRADR